MAVVVVVIVTVYDGQAAVARITTGWIGFLKKFTLKRVSKRVFIH